MRARLVQHPAHQGQRIETVDHGDDTAGERNILTRQAVRITLPVEAFVMAEDDRRLANEGLHATHPGPAAATQAPTVRASWESTVSISSCGLNGLVR